jgi:Rod binding domain-containing protein
MNNLEPILIEPAVKPMPLKQLGNTNFASEERKKQVAKDFESLLINQLLDEMKNTIGNWGFDKDGPCQQIHGIFWFYLAQELANNGGLGLWKDIHQSLTNTEQNTQKAELLDKNI